jgi:hypothetical protein
MLAAVTVAPEGIPLSAHRIRQYLSLPLPSSPSAWQVVALP